MNNTLEGINSRITEAEEWISALEDRMVSHITAPEQNNSKTKTLIRNKESNDIMMKASLHPTRGCNVCKYLCIQLRST